ncbi:hypothetical protein [Nitrosomonas eutropha]|uniref:Virion structural protein n=2 Tax=Nitrosomonas eutropha TaxID=916 RepID=A0ABX5M8A8_9PROT|nr:hypothetical protein [Nitrosomonas eutropha]ABI59703.1 conserved hypothetical protein [Nitrosomonas eutropha C91]PXV82498.1 hypothetical protein C8R14_10770 [Nitrosomonas eutropha]
MWWTIAVFVVALAISVAFQPKSQNQSPTAGQVEAPTAEEGRAIPVLFGTRDIKQANVVWYGDLKTVAIKKKGGKK